jgi:hypothetical protein
VQGRATRHHTVDWSFTPALQTHFEDPMDNLIDSLWWGIRLALLCGLLILYVQDLGYYDFDAVY